MADDAAGEGSAKKGRLLVVEDNLDVLQMLARELSLQEYEVLEFDRGKDALQAVEDETFDLAILDVMLPDMSGYDLCRRIKEDERTRAVPVMLLTALKDPREKIRGLDMGADEFLNKPFQVEELLARVRALLRTAHLTRALEKSLSEFSHLQELKNQLHRYVIHDIRGPMTSIMGALDLLGQEPDPATAKWLVNKSKKGCEAIMEMVHTLLDIDRMERGELEFDRQDVDIVETVRETLEQWVPLGESRRVTVVTELPTAPILIPADKPYVKRAVGNLLANAFRYSPPDESVLVTLTDEADHGVVQVAVSDHGPGVPRELSERVFEPGFSYGAGQEKMPRGFGLGLTLCRMVAKGHGGNAWVEPNVPKGARFVVRFSKNPAP